MLELALLLVVRPLLSLSMFLIVTYAVRWNSLVESITGLGWVSGDALCLQLGCSSLSKERSLTSPSSAATTSQGASFL